LTFYHKNQYYSVDINIKLLSEHGKIPTQGTPCSAGYDLFAAEECVIPSQERRLIKTNIALAIPFGYYCRIAPRSGLAYKNGIDVMAGVIDSDYRGDVGVILYNTDKNSEFKVSKGDKIAQIIFEKCFNVLWQQKDGLQETKRGANGYGHTG